MGALAVWLLWLNPHHAANRAFAAFLVARGGVIVANRAIDENDGPGWDVASRALLLATVPLIVILLVTYVRPASRRRFTIVAALMAFLLIVEAFYLVVPCAAECSVEGRRWIGPLGLLTFGLTPALGTSGLLLVIRARRAARDQRGADLLLGAAFALNSLLVSSTSLTFEALSPPGSLARLYYPSPWTIPSLALVGFAIIPSIVALVLVAIGVGRTVSMVTLASALVIGGIGIVTGASPLIGDQATNSALSLAGVALLMLPAMGTYALLRHGLFDIDLRIKNTVHRGMVGGAFLAVFFIVAQVAQNYLSEAMGYLAGGVAAGILLFALRPLEHAGERIADRLFPHVRSVSQMGDDERVALYRGQASLAWADGVLDPSERRMLDDLRVRLQLSHEQAALLERESLSLGGAFQR
jgi:hypothetical protein